MDDIIIIDDWGPAPDYKTGFYMGIDMAKTEADVSTFVPVETVQSTIDETLLASRKLHQRTIQLTGFYDNVRRSLGNSLSDAIVAYDRFVRDLNDPLTYEIDRIKSGTVGDEWRHPSTIDSQSASCYNTAGGSDSAV